MRRRRDGAESTFETVRARYDAWAASRPPRPAYDASWSPREPEPPLAMGKLVLTAIGVGTGVVLLALAGYAFYSAAWWADAGREPAAIGYATVGVFLIVAGVGAIAATLNHMFRVLDPNRRAAPAHH
jgi:hypothetical protein